MIFRKDFNQEIVLHPRVHGFGFAADMSQPRACIGSRQVGKCILLASFSGAENIRMAMPNVHRPGKQHCHFKIRAIRRISESIKPVPGHFGFDPVMAGFTVHLYTI